jgi:hypothetical protein
MKTNAKMPKAARNKTNILISGTLKKISAKSD